MQADKLTASFKLLLRMYLPALVIVLYALPEFVPLPRINRVAESAAVWVTVPPEISVNESEAALIGAAIE